MSTIFRSCLLSAALLASFGASLASAQMTATAPASAPASQPRPVTVTLQTSPHALDMDSLKKNKLGYYPSALQLVTEKPAAITREPAYIGKPAYGAFRIGNGPRSLTLCVIDEPDAPDKPGKIYVDRNQNGDLTDDGPGTWDDVKKLDTGGLYYTTTLDLHASWGSPLVEDTGATYSLMVYMWHDRPRPNYVRISAQAGALTLDGKSYHILLCENNSDGLFIVPASNERTRKPLELLIDLNGDGTFAGFSETVNGKTVNTSEHFSLSSPFKIGDRWYTASPNISGTQLVVGPSNAAAASLVRANAPAADRPTRNLLAAGTPAPDFTALTPDGKNLKLSDFKGKLVIVDFWATWCGPCKVSMPGLQKTYDKIRDQGVVVLSVCVWDDKPLFDTFIKQNSGTTYNFTFAFDPAAKDTEKSIAAAQFGVAGIPTMYVITREGKVAAAIVGSGQENAMIAALKDQGIKFATE